jgi:hypothetical protein
MKQVMRFVVMVFLVTGGLLQTATAGEIDRLVRELVKKGVIEPGKAQEILTLTEQDIKKELVKAEVETVPKWSQVISLNGDFRLRNQWEKKDGSDSRMRQRIRFRLKGEARVAQGFRVGFGLATGGNDPRSTNQTLENMFETKGVQLDYAYGMYSAPKYLTLIGGKFANKLSIWKPTDLLWDSDITLEGGAALVRHKTFYLNSGVYVLDEKKTDDDPKLFVFQPGYKTVINEKIDLQAAFSYYKFDGLKGLVPDHTKLTNSSVIDTVTGKATGQLIYDYTPLGFSANLGVKNLVFPYVAVFTEYYQNPDPSKDNSAYIFGLLFGAEKVKSKKQWQVKYLYRHLEKDAWPDFLPDSDSYGGSTGIQGHELILNYGLSKNIYLTFDYYNIEDIASKDSQYLFQTDLNFKF